LESQIKAQIGYRICCRASPVQHYEVMKDLLKWPLIVAAVVVILRVVLELAGFSNSVTRLLSVVALHLVIVPVYFGVRLGLSGQQRRYLTLLKLVASFVVLTRAMLIPVYWLAHIEGWEQQRFGGLGPDTPPFIAYFTIPFATAAFWIAASLVIGNALGSVALAITSRLSPAKNRVNVV
jgi:hypothetical protein